MNKYLFLFTVGPVQSFIGQARKTQDLYAGSFLLSHLIDSAMKEIEDKVNNCKFIFPHKNIKSKPNRFIAEIEYDDAGKAGKDLKDFVETEFEDIAKIALDSLDINYDNDFKHSFLSQIKTHLQVNWVALPLEKNYEATYKELESYLGSIKNVKAFKQLNNGRGEIGRKCSLCGERNVLFYRGRKRAYTTDSAVSLDRQPSRYMSDGEGLCAVCFTKRFADKYQNFKDKYEKNYPSTAEIALMDSLNNLDSGLLDKYEEIFGDNFDEELYYEDSLTERYFRKNNYPAEKLEDAKVYLRKISEKARENKVTFSRYYAILMLDGDNMGRWLSGEFLEEHEKIRLEDFHKKLTEQLGSFAQSVKDIIKEPKGKLVYAGGDDVLAFINLNQLLPLMKRLREEFPKFEGFGFEIKGNNKSSPSVGIAIAHYKTPLSEALNWARKMEKEAKKNGGRDAFAIAVLKRSGGISKTMFKWQYGDSSSIEILEHLIKSLKPKEGSEQADFSNTFIKNLGIEFRWLMDEEGKYKEGDIIKTEMKRLVGRSCLMTRGEGETKEDFKKKKKQAIADLTEKLDRLYTNKSLDNFLSSLEIADFIKRGGS
ncbi:CRISPR-associated protein [archaeon BMS3Bbin15]|nr:CRISPR-associated protein [archaeon BMS3Bbin15]